MLIAMCCTHPRANSISASVNFILQWGVGDLCGSKPLGKRLHFKAVAPLSNTDKATSFQKLPVTSHLPPPLTKKEKFFALFFIGSDQVVI